MDQRIVSWRRQATYGAVLLVLSWVTLLVATFLLRLKLLGDPWWAGISMGIAFNLACVAEEVVAHLLLYRPRTRTLLWRCAIWLVGWTLASWISQFTAFQFNSSWGSLQLWSMLTRGSLAEAFVPM